MILTAQDGSRQRLRFSERFSGLWGESFLIAEWQGHKDGGKLILQTYSHVRPAHSQRMAKLMTDGEPDNVVPMHSAAAS